jgi:hypothetical protein
VADFENILASQGSHVVSVVPQDKDSVFLARDLVDACEPDRLESKA